MSILIKGMDMPETCGRCWFRINVANMCLINLRKLGPENIFFRPNECPLVDVEEERNE